MHKRKTKRLKKDEFFESVLRLNLIFNVIERNSLPDVSALSAQDYIESIYQVIQFWLNKSPNVTKIIWSRQR